MKTTLTKIALLGIAGAIAFALCSFKSIPAVKPLPTTIDDEWTEWNKVNEFIDKNIVSEIAKNDKENKRVKTDFFSRCPSGYNSQIVGQYEEVKTDRDVRGKVVFYKGCGQKYICDFKVCVDKGEALVKNKDASDYMSVKEWIADKNKTPTKSSLVKS
jgi:hypothetical protein